MDSFVLMPLKCVIESSCLSFFLSFFWKEVKDVQMSKVLINDEEGEEVCEGSTRSLFPSIGVTAGRVKHTSLTKHEKNEKETSSQEQIVLNFFLSVDSFSAFKTYPCLPSFILYIISL
jgi:hypothetical protein